MQNQNLQVEYQLLAQSPMLHFQSQQEDAALRATEVKPKLDRYIKKRAEREGRNIIGWQRRDRSSSLQYKMYFTDVQDVEHKTEQKEEFCDLYYGTNARPVCRNVQMHIVCFVPSLMDYIQQIIGDFFLVHNFGADQHKGFGSFCVEGWNQSPSYVAQQMKQCYQTKHCYRAASTSPFETIKALYGALKSGRSEALLFRYLDTKGIPHEKSGEAETFYTRVLLGMGKAAKMDFPGGPHRIECRITSERFKRIASPVFFKIVDGAVYWVGMPLSRDVCGQSFTFKPTDGGVWKRLQTPDWDRLDGAHFMDDLMAYCYTHQTAVRERIEQL